MASTSVKLSAEPAAAMSTRELKAHVRKLYELDVEIAALETKKAEADRLRAVLRGQYASKPGEQGFTVVGKNCFCTIGAAGNERRIKSMPLVFATVGVTDFLANASMTLKKLESLVEPAVMADLVTTERTGPRAIKTFSKAD